MHIRSIAVPLDGSRLAEQALPVAAAIARAARARLRLVLVHQLPPPPTDKASAKLYVSIEVALRKSQRDYLRGTQRDYLRGLAKQLGDTYGIKTTAVSPTGPVAETLTEWVHDAGADLVVMTTHGRGALGRALLGSVADRLVRTLEVPIVLLRPGGDEGAAPALRDWSPREIVVGLDGSRLAEAVLPPAIELARLFRVSLTLLQVIEPLPVASDPPLPIPTGYDERVTEALRGEAQDYLESVAEMVRKEGVQASAAARLGWSAAGTLLDLTPEHAGLLAIATHGRSGLKRALVGSVADKLVRAAQVPVLVVRPRGRRAT
jgi:nucleotide-binding universal stress UspA family protein